MFGAERDTLRVDVPVGFLLPGPREIAVSVDRPSDTPLSIRLRLIPARSDEPPADAPAPPDAPPLTVRRRIRDPDAYLDCEYGGSD